MSVYLYSGGGHSVIVLFNSQGDKLIELQGPSTNHWVSVVMQ